MSTTSPIQPIVRRLESQNLFSSMLNEIQEAYRYRNVTFTFVSTNLKQKYRRSILGFLWSILAPIAQFGVIGWVFSWSANRMPNFMGYAFFAAITYNLISNVLNSSAHTLIGNENFIRKIYIPKLVFVLNTVFYEFVVFLLNLAGISLLMFVLGKFQFSWALFSVVPGLLIIMLFLIGLAAFVSVAAVFFRDIIFILPVVIQAMMFGTPIYYDITFVPEKFRWLMEYNPLYSMIELVRTPFWRGEVVNNSFASYAGSVALIVFFLGLAVLKKADNKIVFKL